MELVITSGTPQGYVVGPWSRRCKELTDHNCHTHRRESAG